MLFRLWSTSVSGFPRRGSMPTGPATRPTPPSSNRTCGFPASGSPESSRLKLAQALQIHQSHIMQMLVETYSFWRSIRPLTASS